MSNISISSLTCFPPGLLLAAPFLEFTPHSPVVLYLSPVNSASFFLLCTWLLPLLDPSVLKALATPTSLLPCLGA